MLLPAQAQASSGLQVTIWDNQTPDNQFNDAPPVPPTTNIVASFVAPVVDYDFDMNPIAGVPYDDFIVKYEGYLTATESGTANLQCLADDGCIVIIDGQTIINEWYDKGTWGEVYQYQLVPNQSLPFTLWYYENGGGAVVQLRWMLENQGWQVVPASVFSTAPVVTTVVDAPTDTHTAQVEETSTVPSEPDSPTVVVSDTSTETVTQETVTPPAVQDTQTSTLDTSVGSVSESPSVVVSDETQTSTSESSTQTIPLETSTPIVETPLPTPVPVVEPQPVPQPVPVVVEPQPVPQPEPVPVPEPEPIPEEPPLEEPPSEEQPVVEEQVPVEEPSEHPVEEETNETPVEEPEIQVQPEPTPEPSPQPSAEPAPNSQPDTAYEPPTVTLDNGVILTQEVAAQVELLQNPSELLSELFTNPGAALAALGAVGADMSPEAREKSKKAVVQAVVVGSIVTQAAGAAAYRRKP